MGAGEDIRRSRLSKKVRIGQGKLRNSRYLLSRGPLVIYGDENNNVKRTAKNLPGVDTVNVHRLNLLQLAPGGHLGRFIIWTKDAFQALNKIFGNYRAKGVEKGGYVMNRNLMTCADLARIINSDQVQSKLRTIRTHEVLHDKTKRNPLKNKGLMRRLNPFDATRKQTQHAAELAAHQKRTATTKAQRKSLRKAQAQRRKTYNSLASGLQESFRKQDEQWYKEEKQEFGNAEEEEDDE